MTPNTDWTGIPHTCSTAKPRYKTVSNAKVVTLDNAHIRGSEIEGASLLADGAVLKPYAGRQRIEVQCLWFGRKPANTWMNITLRSKPVFNDRFTGEVVESVSNGQ
jgi:hypothetical protein